MAIERRIAPTSLRLVILALAGLLIALLGWWPMIAQYPHTPELDGQYSFYQFEIGKAIISRYHEFPLWNPYDCRGIAHWDFPESMGASPLLLLGFWLPPLIQYYLWNIIHCAAGFVGMWLLVRDDLKLSRIATFAAATAWALGAAHTAQYSTGHVMMAGFWNFPLLLFLWRKAEHSVGAAIGVGVVLTWMIFDGGTYPVPFCVLLLVLEAATRLTSLARARAVVVSGLITGATGILLAAPRLLPIAKQFSGHVRPNPYPDVDGITNMGNVKSMFLMRQTQWSLHLPGQQYVWNEYIAYLGIAGFLIAIVGMCIAATRRRWLVVLTLLTFVLMLGHFANWAPWHILQTRVFPFTSMRVASRFRFFMTAFAALFVAIAIDELPPLVGRFAGPSRAKIARVAVIGLAFLSAGDVMGFGYDMLTARFGWAPPVEVEASPRFYYGGPGLTPVFTDQPRQNRAWTGCRAVSWAFYENAPVWTGDVPQARAADANATVANVHRTPNRFSFETDVKAPTARIRLNSAYGDGWRTNVGTVVNDGDLLAVDVPEGHHVVRLRYWPNYLTLGLWMAFAGIVGIAAYAFRKQLIRPTSKPSAEA